MAITPTVMIAAQGMLSGGGVGVNSEMTSAISGGTSNPITGGIASLQSQVAVLTGKGDTTNAAALTTALGSMPSAFTSVNSAAAAATTQAEQMAPNPKTFISLHSSGTAFGTASTEYNAALANYGDKSFADLGVGVSSFTDANSGGLTSLMPGFGALANQAKTSAFGGIGANLDPTALAKGQAQMASAGLADGLKDVGTGLKNFGSLQDFSNPQSMGAQGMLVSLQKQGLADSVGINDAISAAGYSPSKPTTIPDAVLKNVFSQVQGSDLQKIISQTGANPVVTPNNLNDLMDPSFMMPKGAVAAMGISPGSGVAGLKSLGNTMTNIGVPMDNVSAASLLGGVKTNVGPYLSGLTTLLPTSVTSALKPFLGSGSGPFGNPSMSDMMGTVSGKHTADFSSAGSQLASIASSSQGQSFASAMTAVMAAVSSGTGISAALAALSTASSTFSSAAASNSSLSGAMSSISGSMSNVTGHLSLEQSNLSQAGLSLASIPTSSGAGSILSFASKLHSFGEDKMQLGHADIFNGVATNDLSGDALKAALLEGKNVSAMSGAGKSPPTVSNTQAALTAANSSGLDDSINNVNSLFATYKQAKSTNDSDLAKFKDIQGQLQANPGDAGLTQQLATAKQTALTSLNAQTDAYLAFTTANDKLSDMIFTASPADMKKIQTAKESYTVT